MRRAALLIALAVGAGCKDEPPPPAPRKVKKKVDTNRIPAPNHSPEALMDPGKPRRVSNAGEMEADLSGKRQHFVFFPRGGNAAVHYPDKDTAWVKIQGALTDEGTPSLTFTLDPLNLGELEFPATFIAGESKKGQPTLQVEYALSDLDRWSTDTTSERPMRLTLESLEGRRLSGTFEGQLPPKAPNANDAIDIAKGTFAVDLRLTGIKRKPTAKPEPEPNESE